MAKRQKTYFGEVGPTARMIHKTLLPSLFALGLFANEPRPTTKLKNGLSIEVGGSYNSIKLSQHAKGEAFLSLFSEGSLAALGETQGEANPYQKTHLTLAPYAGLGYLHHLGESRWFLGGKAGYQYLGLTFSQNNLSFPAGPYLTVGGSGDSFAGYLLVQSSQTEIAHELFFLPFFGYFVNKSSFYLGGGPIAFTSSNDLYGIINSLQVNGSSSLAGGTFTNLSFYEWLWGAIAQIGWIYSFKDTFFLDLSYSYAITAKNEIKDTTLFSHDLFSSARYVAEGRASFTIKEQIAVQSFSVALSKLF